MNNIIPNNIPNNIPINSINNLSVHFQQPQIVRPPLNNHVQTHIQTNQGQTFFYPAHPPIDPFISNANINANLNANLNANVNANANTNAFNAFVLNGLNGGAPPAHYFGNQGNYVYVPVPFPAHAAVPMHPQPPLTPQRKQESNHSDGNKIDSVDSAIGKFNAIHEKIWDLIGDLKSGEESWKPSENTWFLIEEYKNIIHATGILLLKHAVNTNNTNNTNKKEHIEKYTDCMNLANQAAEQLKKYDINVFHSKLASMVQSPKELLDRFNKDASPKKKKKISPTKTMPPSPGVFMEFNINTNAEAHIAPVSASKKLKSNHKRRKLCAFRNPDKFNNDTVLSVKKFSGDLTNSLLRFYTPGYQLSAEDFAEYIHSTKSIEETIIARFALILFFGDLKEAGKNNIFPFQAVEYLIKLRRKYDDKNETIRSNVQRLMLNKMTPRYIVNFMYSLHKVNPIYNESDDDAATDEIKKIRQYLRANVKHLTLYKGLKFAYDYTRQNPNDNDTFPNLNFHEFLVSVNPNWNNELAKHFSVAHNTEAQNTGMQNTNITGIQEISAPVLVNQDWNPEFLAPALLDPASFNF